MIFRSHLRIRDEWFVVALTLLFAGMTLLMVGEKHPWLRLLLPFLMLGVWRLLPRFRSAFSASAGNRILVASVLLIVALLAGIRIYQFGRQMASPNAWISDIPRAYREAAISLFVDRRNPYAVPLDPADRKDGRASFGWIQYTPLQVFTYAPFFIAFGLKGAYVANLFAYLGLALLIFFTLKKASLLNALTGVFWLLASDHVFTLCFHVGGSDILPVFLAVAAGVILSGNRKGAWLWAGILLGLSGLAKQLPAGLFGLVWLLEGNFRTVGMALAVVLAGCAPFLIADPVAFWRNVITLQLGRPFHRSSLIYHLPVFWKFGLQVLGIAMVVMTGLLGSRNREWLSRNFWGVLAFATALFLIFARTGSVNYFSWLTPLVILWLLQDSGRELAPAQAGRETERPSVV